MSTRIRPPVRGSWDDVAAQADALNNPDPCPVCRAETGDWCVNPITGQHLAANVSHWQRIPAGAR